MASQTTQPALSTLSVSGPSLATLMKAVLSKGALFRFKARGQSMSPFIKNGDVLTVAPLRATCPHVGDIVAFIDPLTKGLTLHRVIQRRNGSYLITSDKSDREDLAGQAVPLTNILGSVVRAERDGKKVRLGLGPERFLIALLVRQRLLTPLLASLRTILWPLTRGRTVSARPRS